MKDAIDHFCQLTAIRVEQYARDYHGLESIKDPAIRSARQLGLVPSVSFAARIALADELHEEANLCLVVRRVDPTTFGSNFDESHRAVAKLLAIEADPAALATALDAVAQALEKINHLPYADDAP